MKSGVVQKDPKYSEGQQEQPSKKGGKRAVESSLSASTIAKALSGIDLPKSKSEIQDFVRKSSGTKIGRIRKSSILHIIDKIETQKYHNMVDIEKEIGRML
ncbi:MAG: hypothetical protein L0H53_08220 [Candidatus Nitrosocosmicus sp.]|nr:hypothetical protein [Candidatus Nitrosocosmicus sp.]MDN5867177.1 hypothetical protein [Candidatus Nitrosocosmicus sp.]